MTMKGMHHMSGSFVKMMRFAYGTPQKQIAGTGSVIVCWTDLHTWDYANIWIIIPDPPQQQNRPSIPSGMQDQPMRIIWQHYSI